MSGRLYYGPQHTVEVLAAIISGDDTQEKLAEELGISERTVYNKTHDPKLLSLIEKVDGQYETSKEARRLVQLDDKSVLEDLFTELEGIEPVLQTLREDGMTTEEVGRLISFETESGASTPQRFRDYGGVYADWLAFLDLGEVEATPKKVKGPLGNDTGANNPRVDPQFAIEALREMDSVSSTEELAQKLGCSFKQAEKALTTCYGLRLATPKSGDGYSVTDRGTEVRTTSQGKQQDHLREGLLKFPLVEAFCKRVPEGEFEAKDVMAEVSHDFSMGWSEKTVSTYANRLEPWLVFTGIAEETSQGTLIPTDVMYSSASDTETGQSTDDGEADEDDIEATTDGVDQQKPESAEDGSSGRLEQQTLFD